MSRKHYYYYLKQQSLANSIIITLALTNEIAWYVIF